MAKKKSHRRRAPKALSPREQARRRLGEINWWLVLLLALNTILFFGVYRVLVNFGYFVHAFTGFGLLLIGFLAAYLIYNRGLIPQALKREQLPADWSEAKKDEFLADAARRIKRSKWMLLIIFPLCITFAYEIIDVLLLDVWRS
ncbi:MAG: hypothetical protein IKL84_05680 [Clostridia bacterium]|nr:hypothetical protein [Clostridia bacterium]